MIHGKGIDKFIDIIGDKDGATLAILYSKNKQKLKKQTNYALLKKTLSMPIRVIHAV